jgi:ketosteroid isomerase-like protein
MKKIIASTLFILSVAIANAQNKQEAAVVKSMQRLHTAMINADKSELEIMAAEQLTYGHSSGQIDNKKEFVEKIVSGKSDFVSIEVEDVLVKVSGKTAIIRHRLFARTNDGGKPGEVQLRVLLVWQKDGGKWKLLARQAVKIS